MENFKRSADGFSYVFDTVFRSTDPIIIRLPDAKTSKRSISDIGWQTNADGTLYGTICSDFEDALWDEIKADCEINKTTAALKFVPKEGSFSAAEGGRLAVRIIYS